MIEKLLDEPYWDLSDIDEVKKHLETTKIRSKVSRPYLITGNRERQLTDIFIANSLDALGGGNPSDLTPEAYQEVRDYISKTEGVSLKKQVINQFEFKMGQWDEHLSEKEFKLMKQFLKETTNLQELFDLFHFHANSLKASRRGK